MTLLERGKIYSFLMSIITFKHVTHSRQIKPDNILQWGYFKIFRWRKYSNLLKIQINY